MVQFVIAQAPADSPAVRWCFQQYAEEMGRLFAYVVDEALPLGLEALTPPRGLVLLVRDEGGEPVGCGAVKLDQPEISEIKRMWVAPRARGLGLGGRLLEALEARAVAAGKSVARLDSNETLTPAMAMYRNHGYHDVPAFNAEPFATHWMEKVLS